MAGVYTIIYIHSSHLHVCIIHCITYIYWYDVCTQHVANVCIDFMLLDYWLKFLSFLVLHTTYVLYIMYML